MKHAPRAIAVWIVLSTVLVATGWVLSLFHLLNATGYLIAFALCVLVGRKQLNRWRSAWTQNRFQARWRFRLKHALPAMFVLLALLAIGGGFFYPPGNYDALTYRVPRMLNWGVEEQWHWIHTANPRMNDRACGFEWLAMPLLIFTKTDRLIFLINSVSFLLLPGLIFSVFIRLGVRTRVAWSWMWILPSGYSFLLQAGGASNDMFTVPYVLAAVDYALRARQRGRAADLWFSILAAGLMTGAKGTTLPLLLPWFVALLPSWRLLSATPVKSAVVISLSILISFFPTALLNHKYCSDWSGARLEISSPPPPVVSFAGNAIQLLIQNFCPTVFPVAKWWNEHLWDFIPSSVRAPLQHSWEPGFLSLGELPIEDSAPLGFGVSVLLLVSLVCVLQKKIRGVHCLKDGSLKRVYPSSFNRLLLFLPWCSLLVYMVKVGFTSTGRLITPYYILLFPILLQSSLHEIVLKQRWWRCVSPGILWVAVFVIAVNPARPLWPARAVLARLRQWKPDSNLVARTQTVYKIYAERHDALAPIRDLVPAQIERIGFVASLDDPETSLWRPFGSRRIIHVLPSDTVADLRRKGIQYVIVGPEMSKWFHLTLHEWLERYQAELVAEATFAHRASLPAQRWRLVRLRAD